MRKAEHGWSEGEVVLVHFDGDKMGIKQLRNAIILKGLALHHVAPVACGVSHGQEDRLVFHSGFLKSLRAPGIPVNL